MTRFPALKGRQVIRALERAGFRVHHVVVSHVVLKHENKPLRVTVPVHAGRDLKRGTLQAIERSAGLTGEEFLDLL